MTSPAPARRLSFLPAFAYFLNETYAPALHLAFAAGWFIALNGAITIANGRNWHPAPALSAGVFILFTVLFYLRAADELKDLDYDRQFNPERPLVRGTVTPDQVHGFMLASAAIVFAVHIYTFGPSLASRILALDIFYGYALIHLERFSSFIRDNIWVNLVITYPVNVALSVYTLALSSPFSRPAIACVVAFALAFLHYEFARKISWPQHAKPGRRLYSHSLGTQGAALAATSFAIGGVLLITTLLSHAGLIRYLPLAALVPVFSGLRRLAAKTDKATPMTGPAMQFLVLFYTTVIIVAVRTWLW